MLIGFGKFKHRSWEDVVDKDHQYVEWALGNLDVNRFDIPDHALELYLDKMRHDTKSKTLTKMWRDRKSIVETQREVKEAERIVDTMEMKNIREFDHDVIAFEDACMEAFGKFPFGKWDNYYAA